MVHTAKCYPQHECEKGYDTDDWHKDERCFVGNALQWRFRLLRLAHHTGDMRQDCLLAYLTGTHRELALAGNSSGKHLRTLALLHGYGFTRNHTFIDIGGIGSHKTLSLDDFTIYWHLLARAHLEQVALADGSYGHFADHGRSDDVARLILHRFLLYDVCSLGRHTYQTADGRCSASFGFVFKYTASEHKGYDHH